MKARQLKTKYHQQHHKFSVKNLGAPCKENHWTLYKRLQYSKVIMEMTDTFWMRLQNWSIPECILLKGCVQRLWWVSAVQTIFQNITFLKKMGGGEREYVKTARWMLGQVQQWQWAFLCTQPGWFPAIAGKLLCKGFSITKPLDSPSPCVILSDSEMDCELYVRILNMWLVRHLEQTVWKGWKLGEIKQEEWKRARYKERFS